MFLFPPSVRIFFATGATDMRKGFDTLGALVRDVISKNPLDGHLFVFCSRRRDRCKILYWTSGGFCLWYRRLEKGVFRFPESSAKSIEMEAADLAIILEGIDLRHAKRRKRYVPNAKRNS